MSSMLFLRSVGRASAGVLAAAMVVGMAAPVAVAGPVERAVVPVAGSTALVSPTTLPPAKDTCKTGFVWREAYPGDVVCVMPDIRDQARADNEAGPGRVEPDKNGYGPQACKSGYVWREAEKSDRVCVTPQVRQQTAADNAAAVQRRASAPAPVPAEAGEVVPEAGEVVAVFELFGSGTADAVVTDPGAYENDRKLPFRKEIRVPADIQLLQVHTSGTHSNNVSCRITLDGKVVVQHAGGNCVYHTHGQ